MANVARVWTPRRAGASRRAALTALLVTTCVSAVAPSAYPAGAAADVRAPRVLIYGDSIMLDASTATIADLRAQGTVVDDTSAGGTAPCDEFSHAATDVATFHPDVVVIAYVGDAISPCMAGTTATHPSLERHYLDTIHLIDLVDRPVVLATPPGAIGDPLDTPYRMMLRMVQRITGRSTLVADTATALVDPKSEHFKLKMSCFKDEHCTSVAVRGPDHFHLSDAGATRYANFLSHELQRVLVSTRRAYGAVRAADPSIMTPVSIPYVTTFVECEFLVEPPP